MPEYQLHHDYYYYNLQVRGAGAGNSAVYVAREFVARGAVGAKGDLCLVGEEPVLPYERPALSKAVLIKGNVRLPGFHTCVGGGGERQTADWYAHKCIDTILGEKVTECDLANKTLITDKGNTIQPSAIRALLAP